MILSREQILQVNDLKSETVSVPEWGGEVIVRALKLAQVEEWRRSLVTKQVNKIAGKTSVEYVFDRDKATFSEVRLVALSIVGEDGSVLFTEGDVAALADKSVVALQRVAKVAFRISGLRVEDKEEADAFSEPGPS